MAERRRDKRMRKWGGDVVHSDKLDANGSEV